MSDGDAGRRDLCVGLAIFAIALVARLVAQLEVRALPTVETLVIDAAAYDAWARRVAAGDWLGDSVFYQAPAYPYLMALIYSLPGPDLVMLRIAQGLMGSASCVLAFATTRTLFGRSAGIAAGLLLALYPPAIFFDGIVQKTSLGLLLTSALLLALVRFQALPRLSTLVGAGLVLGLLALTRENALILIPMVAGWLVLRFWSRPLATRALYVAVLAASLALPLGSVAFRNHVVGDTWALTTSQLGTNFFYGNNPDASGGYIPLLPGRHTPVFEGPDARRLAEEALGRTLSAGEVSSYWLGRGLDWMREDPIGWAALTFRKWLFVWNDFEMPDTEDIYVYAETSSVLRATGRVLGFGIVLPLVAAGMALAWRRPGGFRDTWLFAAAALVYALGVTVFLVLARFRFPLIPLLLPFAGLALAELAAALRERRLRPPLVPLAAFIAGAIVANLPLHDRSALMATSYLNFGSIELREGELEPAERYLIRAKTLAPNSADVQFHLAALRLEQGRLSDAERMLRRLEAFHAPDHKVHERLARVLALQGRHAEAKKERERARALQPELRGAPRPE